MVIGKTLPKDPYIEIGEARARGQVLLEKRQRQKIAESGITEANTLLEKLRSLSQTEAANEARWQNEEDSINYRYSQAQEHKFQQQRAATGMQPQERKNWLSYLESQYKKEIAPQDALWKKQKAERTKIDTEQAKIESKLREIAKRSYYTDATRSNIESAIKGNKSYVEQIKGQEQARVDIKQRNRAMTKQYTITKKDVAESGGKLKPRNIGQVVMVSKYKTPSVAGAGWIYTGVGKKRQPLIKKTTRLYQLQTGAKPIDTIQKGLPMEVNGVPVTQKLKAKDVLESYLKQQQEMAALGIKDVKYKGADYKPTTTEYAKPIYTDRTRSTLSGWVTKTKGGAKGFKLKKYTLPSGITGSIPIPTGEKITYEKAPKIDVDEKLMWEGYTEKQIKRGKELVGLEGG